MPMIKRTISAFIGFVLLISLFTGCGALAGKPDSPQGLYSSFRDIPGITREEIDAIEFLRANRSSFSYAMTPSAETFAGENNEINGYSALLCHWLTDLFGVPFNPTYYSWGDLLAGLETGEIDFTGEMTMTEERVNPSDPNQKPYYMTTGAIAERALKYFRLSGARPLSETTDRPLKLAILRGTTTISEVSAVLPEGTFEIVPFDDSGEVYDMLRSGIADAYINEGPAESIFDGYNDVIAEDFYPMIYSPVSLTTQNPELKAIISIVQKALENGGSQYLSELYHQGYQEYRKHKLRLQLTDDERAYIQQHTVIPFAVEYDNYPVAFFNKYDKEWQGISIDVMHEIEKYTGLRFEIINSPTTEWSALLNMVETGEALMISELIRSESREGRFLWADKVLMADRHALISKSDFRNLSASEILYVTVGLGKNIAHTEVFEKKFPNHPNSVYYDDTDLVLDALTRGEVDMMMTSYNKLLKVTNYEELVGYKVNIIFDERFESTYGFNKNEELLCSIVNKALNLIDIERISAYWLNKTFDYNAKVLRAQRPWLIGTAALSVVVTILVIVLFVIKRHERKNLANLVLERTNELEAVINNYKGVIWSVDVNGIIKIFNGQYLKIIGVTPDFLLGKNINVARIKNRHLDIIENIDKTLREGPQEWEGEIDGGIFYSTARPIYDANNNVRGVVGSTDDITERKKIEKMITTLNEMSVLFLTMDEKTYEDKMTAGVGLIANAMNFDRISVWRISMTPGGPFTSQIYRWDRVSGGTTLPNPEWQNRPLNQLMQEWEKIETGEIVISGPVNSMIDPPPALKYLNVVSAHITPVVINNERWGFVLYEDRRNERFFKDDAVEIMRSAAFLCANTVMRSELESKLNEALITATAASRAKSDFLSHMSHEIRTPLNAVIGMINIGMSTDDIEKIKYCLNRADSASKHLLGIINDILDMSKIEADKFELSRSEIDFEKMLRNVTDVTNVRAEEKQINFIVNLSDNVPAYIEGDELRLSQVITNLLTNAIKFTPEKGTVELNTTKTEENGDEVTLRIEVADTGIGIAKEQQDQLFKSFMQADASITKKYGGTGLGLAISKRIVELMGGDIWVESELGKGSKFIFTIKAKQLALRSRVKLAQNIKKENMHILAVDDSAETREHFVHVMEALKLSCDVADSGEEALSMIKNAGDKPYNIFFVDWQMPEMDGIKLTKKIKEINGENSIVIMISVADWNTIETKAVAAGVKHFVSKPLFPSALINAINICIGEEAGLGEAGAQNKPGRRLYDFFAHTILIAEDVEINREIISAILEETNISIEFAGNGKIAVSMFCARPERYSLILMDINMPEMDGYEATRRIRALDLPRAKEIPIVAMTANVFREDVVKCLESGMDDHTGKPVDAAALIGLLNKYLNHPEKICRMKNVYELARGVAWSEDLLTGNALVDMQHQRLFERVSDLARACEDGSDAEKLWDTLEFLVNHAVRHFTDEEALQLEYGYPHYETHKKLHDDFKVTVGELVQRFKDSGSSMELSRDVNKIMVRWLVTHIRDEDKKICDHIHGVAAAGGYDAKEDKI